jgi:hypothetical protein
MVFVLVIYLDILVYMRKVLLHEGHGGEEEEEGMGTRGG